MLQALDEGQGLGADSPGSGQDLHRCPIKVLAMDLGLVVHDGGVDRYPHDDGHDDHPLSLV